MGKRNIKFNEAIGEIESILEKIENGEMDIDELSSNVKRASELIKLCKKKIKATEEEIESIFSEEE